MSIVYISGPMAGYDGLNEVAFRAAAQEIGEAYAEIGDALRIELIQVAAFATQWAAAIERRAS